LVFKNASYYMTDFCVYSQLLLQHLRKIVQECLRKIVHLPMPGLHFSNLLHTITVSHHIYSFKKNQVAFITDSSSTPIGTALSRFKEPHYIQRLSGDLSEVFRQQLRRLAASNRNIGRHAHSKPAMEFQSKGVKFSESKNLSAQKNHRSLTSLPFNA
jgi:hypothetical protein